MPQPQTLHGAVPLALTPPGKVRKTWALRECLLSSPLPRPLPLCSCCLGSRSHLDLLYNLGKSLLFQGLNEMVGFYNPPSSDIWGPTLILEHTHSFPSLVPNSDLTPKHKYALYKNNNEIQAHVWALSRKKQITHSSIHQPF